MGMEPRDLPRLKQTNLKEKESPEQGLLRLFIRVTPDNLSECK